MRRYRNDGVTDYDDRDVIDNIVVAVVIAVVVFLMWLTQ